MITDEMWRELDDQDDEIFDANSESWLRWAYTFDVRSRRRKVLELLNRYVEVHMTRGKTATKPASTKPANNWTEFVDIKLPDGCWADIQAAYPSFESVQDGLNLILADGYRCSVTYNRANDTFLVSLTCRNEENANSGKTMTSYADNWWTAFQIALYKHNEIAEGDWSAAGKSSTQPRFG